jgi:hypothetical protein
MLLIPFCRKREATSSSLTSYCFDLDGDEGEGRELAHDKFTVDSRLHGTDLLSARFPQRMLNHLDRELDSIHQVRWSSLILSFVFSNCRISVIRVLRTW